MNLTNTNNFLTEFYGPHTTIFHDAPSWLIVVCGSIVLGYIFQISGLVKVRQKISLLVVPFSVALNLIITWHLREGDMVAWVCKQFVAGMVLGFCAWIFHVTILKKVEERLPFLRGALVDAGLDKPDGLS